MEEQPSKFWKKKKMTKEEQPQSHFKIYYHATVIKTVIDKN